jgi:hypothetical protein
LEYSTNILFYGAVSVPKRGEGRARFAALGNGAKKRGRRRRSAYTYRFIFQL